MTLLLRLLQRVQPLTKSGSVGCMYARTCSITMFIKEKTSSPKCYHTSQVTRTPSVTWGSHSTSFPLGLRAYSTSPSDGNTAADRGQLVYTGRVGSMFKMLKLFSLSTSGIGLALQPYLFVTYQDAPLVTAVPFFAALNIFVFVNPFLIHYIGKKYVLEMYFNSETRVFTAVLMSFFARKYSFTFTAEDVKVPDVPGLFAILNVKDRPLFVLDADFTDIEVYKHMMGFDKPLDLTFLKDDKGEK